MSYGHRVCFDCRKSWSLQIHRWGFVRIELDSPQRCPECGQHLVALGRYFKPPKQNNIRQWRKAEAVVQEGFKFTSIGTRVPATLRGMRDFRAVMRQIRQSDGEALAEKFKK